MLAVERFVTLPRLGTVRPAVGGFSAAFPLRSKVFAFALSLLRLVCRIVLITFLLVGDLLQ